MENWKIQIGANNFRVKHLAFHRALALGMTYTKFENLFLLLVFIFLINQYFINSSKDLYKILDGVMLH
jgi:hypothetical protein